MKKEVRILLAIAAVVVIAGMAAAAYYRKSVQSPPAPGTKIAGELVRSDSATIGPADAKVTLVEFYDPECGTCRPVPSGRQRLNEGI